MPLQTRPKPNNFGSVQRFNLGPGAAGMGSVAQTLTSGGGAASKFMTSAPHGLVAGSEVTLTSMSDPSYNGKFTVDTVPDTTSFTIAGLAFTKDATGVFVVTHPEAAFTADNVAPQTGTLVTFTDSSGKTPTSWAWTFGTGEGSSTLQNPTHLYSINGLFTVVLIATNAGGNSTKTLTDYITVSSE